MRHGLLLINLGSPVAPTHTAIRTFLRAFLDSPRVIGLPTWLRKILLYAYVLPIRPFALQHAYRAVWLKEGSPLLVYTHALAKALKNTNTVQFFQIETAVQHGMPSWQEALKKLKAASIDHLTILPLYPQYASATTGAALESVLQALSTEMIIPHVRVISDFYKHPAFIAALGETIQPYLDPQAHTLFSYHGLPVRDLSCEDKCMQSSCPMVMHKNRFCYRAQCFETTRAIIQKLNMDPEKCTVSFQSRFGRIPWIQPYTDATLVELRAKGVLDLVVICPSFTMDCLETLEEIGLRAKSQWLELGGRSFMQVPCLNDHPAWVDAIFKITAMPNTEI